MVVSPLGLAAPFRVAVVLVIAEAGLVVTVGAVAVTTVVSPPNDVPAEFEAMAQ